MQLKALSIDALSSAQSKEKLVDLPYAELKSREVFATQHPAWKLPLDSLRDWESVTGPKGAISDSLGVYYLRNVSICGSGYLFHHDYFIRERGNISNVAAQWLCRADFPDNPFSLSSHRDVDLKSPAVIIIGPGFPIYGHWIVDFLPRLAIARDVLQKSFEDYVLPVPADTPEWVFVLVEALLNIKKDQFVFFDRMKERLRFAHACVPTVAYSGDYIFHSYFKDIYERAKTDSVPTRKLCLSRRNFETSTRSLWRVFENRLAFEKIAQDNGYEIFCPEDYSIESQIEIFGSASCIVGEFGSALHNCVFMQPETKVGCISERNAVQANLGYLKQQVSIFMNRTHDRTDERGVIYTNCMEADIRNFFEKIDAV